MFHCFAQNSSGGSFDFDEKAGISHYVVIEGNSEKDILDKAKNIGLYFNGCEDGVDCECCGDRWSDYMYDLTDFPAVYGEDVSSGFYSGAFKWMAPNPEGFIHYSSGEVKPIYCKKK